MPVLREQDTIQAKAGNNKGKGKMKCSAEVKVYGDADKVFKCFKAEEDIGERVSLKLRKKKEYVSMLIEAKDEVAMRAAFNSAMKGLIVFNKMGRL